MYTSSHSKTTASLFTLPPWLVEPGILDDDTFVLWMTRGIPLSLMTFDTIWKLILFHIIFMETAIVQIRFQLRE